MSVSTFPLPVASRFQVEPAHAGSRSGRPVGTFFLRIQSVASFTLARRQRPHSPAGGQSVLRAVQRPLCRRGA